MTKTYRRLCSPTAITTRNPPVGVLPTPLVIPMDSISIFMQPYLHWDWIFGIIMIHLGRQGKDILHGFAGMIQVDTECTITETMYLPGVEAEAVLEVEAEAAPVAVPVVGMLVLGAVQEAEVLAVGAEAVLNILGLI